MFRTKVHIASTTAGRHDVEQSELRECTLPKPTDGCQKRTSNAAHGGPAGVPAPMSSGAAVPMSAGIVVPPGGARGVPPAGGAAGVPPGGPARHQLASGHACMGQTPASTLRFWYSLLPLYLPKLQWLSRACFHEAHLQVAQPVARPAARSVLPGLQATRPDSRPRAERPDSRPWAVLPASSQA